MRRRTLIVWALCASLTLSACIPIGATMPAGTATAAPPTAPIEPTPTSVSVPSPAQDTPPASASPTAGQGACPTLRPDARKGILQPGSILFEKLGETSKLWALWALSAGQPSPAIVLNLHEGWVVLDPTGQRVALREIQEGKSSLVVYDLQSNQKRSWPWAETWLSIAGWTPEGKVKLLVSEERKRGVGESLVFDLLDPASGMVASMKEELDLPGYKFEKNEPRAGYVALNPTRDLAVYTARGSSGIDTVLRDISKGEDLWRYEARKAGTTFAAPAAWSSDGSKVAFILASEPEVNSQIVSLTSDGKRLSELTSRPLAEYPDYIVNALGWSSNGRYLFYSLFQDAHGGPGFVLDSLTSEIHEVCDPQTTLVKAKWVSDEALLAYVVQQYDGTKELRLLDVNSWQAEVLDSVSTEVFDPIVIVGWTPVEFP